MKALQKRFILQLVVISLVIYAALYVLFTRFIFADLPLVVMVGLLFAVNSLSFILISNTKENKPASFVNAFMGITFGRLLIYTVFVVSYALMHRPEAKTFAVTFFLLYFIYTTVEVRAMYRFFNK